MSNRLPPLSTLRPSGPSLALRLPEASRTSRGLAWRALLVCALAVQARRSLAARSPPPRCSCSCSRPVRSRYRWSRSWLSRCSCESHRCHPVLGQRRWGTVDLSGALAVLFIVMAAGLLAQRRRGVWPTLLAGLWLSFWTLVALQVHGGSTETVRQGVREAAILAIGVIVLNSAREVTVSTAAALCS